MVIYITFVPFVELLMGIEEVLKGALQPLLFLLASQGSMSVRIVFRYVVASSKADKMCDAGRLPSIRTLTGFRMWTDAPPTEHSFLPGHECRAAPILPSP